MEPTGVSSAFPGLHLMVQDSNLPMPAEIRVVIEGRHKGTHSSLPLFTRPFLLVLSSFPFIHIPFRFFPETNTSRIMTASINPSEIPSITALREVLDYGDQHLPRCKRLHDNMRYFRTTFISSKGLEGSSLIDWKSREEQAALAEMTNAFLERDGTGRQFWPDDEASDRFNRLRYSTHHAL